MPTSSPARAHRAALPRAVRSAIGVVLLLAGPAAPLLAQQDAAARRNALSVQPLHAVFGAWSGEYERVLSPAFTLAVGVSALDGEVGDLWDGSGDEDRMLSSELKLRLYSDGRALRGLSLGLMAGMVRERETFYDAPDASSPPPPAGYVVRRAWESMPAYGFLIEHGWFDKGGRGLLAAGIGGKRVLQRGPRPDEAYLTLRLSIGVAF